MTPAERTRAVVDLVLDTMPDRLTRAELLGDSRREQVVRVRDMAAFVLACAGGLTQTAIGRALRRDRSSISVAIGRATRRCTQDADFEQLAAGLVAKAEEHFK